MSIKRQFIKCLDVAGGLRLARYFNRRRPIILMYHRIINDPCLPGIAPDVFSCQLDYIRRNFRAIPMDQLVLELNTNTLKPYTVAITFDDGHEDFYSNAWPLLQEHKLPASLYVSTGFIDNQCWLWPDLLRYELINARTSYVEIEGVGKLTLNSSDILETWNIIGDHCLRLRPETRTKFILELAEKLSVQLSPEPLPPFSPLTWSQLREMHRQGLDVGSHTVSHPILSALSYQDMEKELTTSRKRIETELGVVPSGICYPNGMAEDISEDVESVAKKNYSYGLVAYPGRVEKEKITRLGRWSASPDFLRFKQIMNHLSRNDNFNGEYR